MSVEYTLSKRLGRFGRFDDQVYIPVSIIGRTMRFPNSQVKQESKDVSTVWLDVVNESYIYILVGLSE